MKLTKEEINRKLLHMLSGTAIPAGIFYIPLIPGCSKWTPSIILGLFFIGSMAGEWLRFRSPAVQKLVYKFGGHMLRPNEDKSVTGSTWIFASSLICSLLFVNHLHIAAIVICMFILGDAVAALVGISIGRIKIGKKSLEGSLACFVLCMILLLWAFPSVPLLLDQWHGIIPIRLSIASALCITVCELFPIKIGSFIVNDNLVVPVITGLLMVGLYPFIS